jgi:hypothetical protein
MVLHLLCIGKHVTALLIIDPRDTKEQISLESQRNWGSGLQNCSARSSNIDFLDRFSADSAVSGLESDG